MRRTSAEASATDAAWLGSALRAHKAATASADVALIASLQAITRSQQAFGVQVSSATALGNGFSVRGRAPSIQATLAYSEALRNTALPREVKVMRTESAAGVAPLDFQMRLLPVGEIMGPGDVRAANK